MSSLLILSFSRLERDPRVQRQISLLAEQHEVTTAGFGPAPHPDVRHLEIDEDTRAWPSSKQHLLTRRYRGAYWAMSAVRAAVDVLGPEVGRHDVVLANDTNTLPLALWLSPRRGVHADLHEYAPREKEHERTWRWFVAPYQRWICRTCLPVVRSVTTVSPGLAEEYSARFGVEVEVVTNAAAYEQRTPRPTGSPIRLLHTGVARANRHLESMIEAMRGTSGAVGEDGSPEVELDLMLVPSEPGYIEQLREQAADLPSVHFRDPVPYEHLVETVAEYDMSLVVFPNSTFNLAHSLPNKLFEAVQGRVAVMVGPSPDMAALVQHYGIGDVLPGADAASIGEAIGRLDPARIDGYKQAADRAAAELSAEHQVQGWARAIERILQDD